MKAGRDSAVRQELLLGLQWLNGPWAVTAGSGRLVTGRRMPPAFSPAALRAGGDPFRASVCVRP